jgi:hypothetical protein
MTLEELPTFTIHHIERNRAYGAVDRALWMSERHLGDLLLPEGRFVGGRFFEVDLHSLSTAFVPTLADELPLLEDGQTYRRFDRYWGERAALLLDHHRQWTERRFEPGDAVSYKLPTNTLIGKATNQNLPESGTLIGGGWDHEHCDICWQKISLQTEPVGMLSEPDHWICCKCYEKFVVPRSLDFIYVEESAQSAGGE